MRPGDTHWDLGSLFILAIGGRLWVVTAQKPRQEFLDADPKDYLFVVPYGDGFQDLADEYGETYIVSGYDETAGWILPKTEADNDKFIHDYDVFSIPTKYDTIVQFMRDYEGGHIKVDNLDLIWNNLIHI